MTTVIVFGITGIFVADEIKRVLSHYGLIEVRGSYIKKEQGEPEFLIIECASRAKIDVDGGIIVMIGEAGKSSVLEIPKTFVGIAYSKDLGSLQLLKNNNITTLTCGMSGDNTIILSSVGESTASVCLQRSIKTLDGNIIEPQEYPVHLVEKITDYALMAAFGILLLSGIEPDPTIEY